MRQASRSYIICFGIIFFIICAAPGLLNLQAAENNSKPAQIDEIDPNADISHMSATEALQLAYNTLYLGNHNYDHHRVAAMKEIRKAGEPLKISFEGDGRGHEDQRVSDAQITFARRLLEHARSRIPFGIDQQTVLDHIDAAVKHLSKALQIRAVEDEK